MLIGDNLNTTQTSLSYKKSVGVSPDLRWVEVQVWNFRNSNYIIWQIRRSTSRMFVMLFSSTWTENRNAGIKAFSKLSIYSTRIILVKSIFKVLLSNINSDKAAIYKLFYNCIEFPLLRNCHGSRGCTKGWFDFVLVCPPARIAINTLDKGTVTHKQILPLRWWINVLHYL